MYMDKLSGICQLLNPVTCREFYLYVINHSYQSCSKCETVTKYAQNLFQSPWHAYDGVFKCTVVDQIANVCNDTRYAALCAQLPLQVKVFVKFIEDTCHCRSHIIYRFIVWNETVRNIFLIIALFAFLLLQCLITQHKFSIINFLLNFPVVYLSVIVLFYVTFDVLHVLILFTELNISDPLLVQKVSRGICAVITTILIWCILLVITLKAHHKIKKESTFINIAISLVTFFLSIMMMELNLLFFVLCEIQLFVCQFLLICI